MKRCAKCHRPKSRNGLLCRRCWKITITPKKKLCQVKSCKNLVGTAGFCNMHYLRQRRWGTTDLLPKNRNRKYTSKWKGVTCRIDGCGKPVESAGYCDGHYHRLLRYGDPRYSPRDAKRVLCREPHCTGTSIAVHGFCPRHAKKIYEATQRGTVKRKARLATMYAERKGILVRPNNCEVCGSNYRIEAHHDDYTNPLVVRYLCKKCHAAIHRDQET